MVQGTLTLHSYITIFFRSFLLWLRSWKSPSWPLPQNWNLTVTAKGRDSTCCLTMILVINFCSMRSERMGFWNTVRDMYTRYLRQIWISISNHRFKSLRKSHWRTIRTHYIQHAKLCKYFNTAKRNGQKHRVLFLRVWFLPRRLHWQSDILPWKANKQEADQIKLPKSAKLWMSDVWVYKGQKMVINIVGGNDR